MEAEVGCGFLCWGNGFFGRGSCFLGVPLCNNWTRNVPMAPVARMRTTRGTLVVWPYTKLKS